VKVMKFGGSCLQTAAGLGRMLEIVKKEPRPVAIVLSALKGVTDELISLGERARTSPIDLATLRARHDEALEGLSSERRSTAVRGLEAHFSELERVLKGIAFLGEVPPRTHDRLLSFGERLSVVLATEHLREAGLPAKPLVADEAGVVTTAEPGDARVLPRAWGLARERLREDDDVVYVVTGYVGRDEEGHLTTLGRGGSDYTATFLAAALGGVCVLWKDTPGLLTADPRVVQSPRVIERIGHVDALELAHYGLPAVAEKALYPAMKAGTPIEVRSFQGTEAPTLVGPEEVPALAITFVRDVVMLDLEDKGQGEGDGADFALKGRVLRALAGLLEGLADAGAFPLLLTEASPRGETTIVVKAAHLGLVRAAISRRTGGLDANVRTGLSAVSLIGSGMRGKIGFAASVFECLAREKINIVAIAQTASERNISVVVSRSDAENAVRALHARFVQAS
jgi:aspartate kinase